MCDFNRGDSNRCHAHEQARKGPTGMIPGTPHIDVQGKGFTYRYCREHAIEVANICLRQGNHAWRFDGQSAIQFLGAKKPKGWRDDWAPNIGFDEGGGAIIPRDYKKPKDRPR